MNAMRASACPVDSVLRFFLLILLLIAPFTGCKKEEDPEVVGDTEEQTPSNDDPAMIDEKARQDMEKDRLRTAALHELYSRKLVSKTPAEWYQENFRKSFPYHIQTLALSKPSKDGSRTLIISEPPPATTLDDILLATQDIVQSHIVKRHGIGFDGWVSDVVLSVKGPDESVASALSRLSRILFGTSYKAYAIALPAAVPQQSYNLNLDVSAEEIEAWIGQEGATFVAVESGEEKTASAVFQTPTCSVVSAESKGIIAWWLPKNVSVESCPVEVREFALDSDLLVGAISEENGALIIGRERVVPVDLLPPLRFESVRLLDSAQSGPDGQLAQSYERQYPFAGRADVKNDWAPIYLSPELVDTEYGSLLNITDQILKSWSEGGDVTYYNFKYPAPKGWPYIVKSLNDAGGSLTYNWNTKGATYSVTNNNRVVAALNRTGALPVTYLPEGIAADEMPDEVLRAEDIAYEKFSHQSDPNLVRVVQYAALYQIFSSFREPMRRPDFGSDSSSKYPVLDGLLDNLNLELGQASDEELHKIAAEISTSLNLEISRYVEEDYSNEDVYYNSLLELRKKKEPSTLVESLALSGFAGLRGVPKKYADLQAAEAKGWMHTSAVVLSSAKQQEHAIIVGGHNLFAKMEKIRVSEGVAEGEVKMEDGFLVLNPSDANKGSRLVRTAGRFENKTPEELSMQLSTELRRLSSRPVRSTVDALKLSERRITSLRASVPITHNADLGDHRALGWVRQSSNSASKVAADAAMDGSVVLERRDGIFHISKDGRSPVLAYNIEDATDAIVYLMRRGSVEDGALHIEMRGFDQIEAGKFTKSVQVRASDEKLPREISALVRDDGLSNDRLNKAISEKFDFSKAKITTSDIIETESGLQRSIHIEVPREVDGRIRRSTVELEFSKQTPRGIIETITSRIKEAVHRIVSELGDRIDSVRFNMRLNAEAKKISAETGIDFKIIQQKFDDERGGIYFANKTEPLADSETYGR